MNLIIPPTLDPITESPQPTPLSEETSSTTTTTSTKGKELRDIMMAGTTATGSNAAGTGLNTVTSTESFDVNGAYIRALNDEQVPHPLAAILALTQLMEVSTASTLTGLLKELTSARRMLVDTQPSLGVRAGCQLFERFVSSSGAGEDFPSHKRSLIEQGRSFCAVTAPECRRKIADLAVGFLRDDCVILTHSYSRTVIQALLKAHQQNKRIKVYVAEARPQGLGLKTHQILTQAGIPCTVILDSAIAYILERVDIVLVGTEAVVESGGLVSRVGTSQCAHLARAMGKPFYALAESYKFLRYYPLSQSDLPMPRRWGRRIPLEFDAMEEGDDEDEDDLGDDVGGLFPRGGSSLGHARGGQGANPMSGRFKLPRANTTAPATPRRVSLADSVSGASGTAAGTLANTAPGFDVRWEMTREMEEKNPLVDITGPELVDLVITDLGTISATAISQYLVALFSS